MMLNMPTNSFLMVIMFLLEQFLGNQVGPVSTRKYSCHTHVLCPSILHYRVEHQKRHQSHRQPISICLTIPWILLKNMELKHEHQHNHVSQPSVYTKPTQK